MRLSSKPTGESHLKVLTRSEMMDLSFKRITLMMLKK